MQATFRLDTGPNRTTLDRHVRKRATLQNEEAAICRALERIEYLPRYKALICKDHEYAIRNLEGHLISHHGSILAPVRRAVCAAFADCEVMAPEDINLPEANEPPITQLGRPKLAYACKQRGCRHISTNWKVIAQHCNQDHVWRARGKDRSHWEAVCVQSFFGNRRYFIVRPNPGQLPFINFQIDSERHDAAASTGHESVTGAGQSGSIGTATDTGMRITATMASAASRQRRDRHRHIPDIKRKWSEKLEERKKELEILDAELDKADQTGWWKRTGWPKHLAKANLLYLAWCSRLPDRQEEPELWQATEIVDQLIEDSLAGLHTLPLLTRRWLRSAKPNECDPRPFSHLQTSNSQEIYSRYWKKMIVYALRVWKSGEEKGETAEEEGEDAPLTEEEEHVGDIDYEAEEAEIEDEDEEEQEEDNGNGNGNENENENENTNDTETTLTAEEQQQRQDDKFFDARRLFPWRKGQRAQAAKVWSTIESGASPKKQMLAIRNFSKSFIFQNMLHDRFKSPLIHFLAVLGIEEEFGRLRKANDYSYMLAGMTYCIRAIGVEILLPAKKRRQQHDAATRNFLFLFFAQPKDLSL
jgi:hypothetical protein